MVSGHLQVKKGYYYAVLSFYDSKNKRHVKYISTGLPEKGNKRKAEAELVKIRNAFEPPAEIGELCSNMLFADYLLGWLEIVKVRVKPTTFGSYESMVKQTIEPYFRNKPITLKDLEARHIQQFYSEKLRTVKPNSVIHYHAVIHQALKYAMKTDLVAQNVAMKVDRPKKNDFQPVFLDAAELQRLFEVVKGTKLELPVLVAAFYGLRRGEVLGLKWDAIDFERGTLTIKRTVTSVNVGGKTQIIEQESAKTKSSMRTLPLVGRFKEYFAEVKAAQELNKQVCGNCYNYEYDGFVFVDELGERMRPDYLTSQFPAFIQRHGMKKMRFHDLRHSCASLLLANGVPLKQIQDWLGHSDFSTTANIYAHLDYSSKLSSAQAMVSGMPLPEAGDFGSRWEQNAEKTGHKAKSCSFQNYGKNSSKPGDFWIDHEKRKIQQTRMVTGFLWRRRWDSNPRGAHHAKTISSRSRYDHFDTSPYMSARRFFLPFFGEKGLWKELTERTAKYLVFRTG